MTYQELKKVAKSLNLSTKGKAVELSARIAEKQDQNASAMFEWMEERKGRPGLFLCHVYRAYKARITASPNSLTSKQKNAVWKVMEESFPRMPKRK